MTLFRKAVMIIDDDVKRRKRIYDVLKVTGFDISSAVQGEQAFGCLPRDKPNLIVVNAFAPKVDGLSFIRKLRGFGLGQKMIVVALHAENDDNRKQAQQAGADDFIAENFQPYLLLEIICRHLKIDKIRIPENEFRERRQAVEDLAMSYHKARSRDVNFKGVQLLLPDGRDLSRLMLTDDAGVAKNR